MSHDHVFQKWSTKSKIKKCHARNVTRNSVTNIIIIIIIIIITIIIIISIINIY